MDWFDKLMVGLSAGLVVMIGSFTLMAFLDYQGIPPFSGIQAATQMVYFVLVSWGAVALFGHQYSRLREKLETAEERADWQESRKLDQTRYKEFYDKLSQRYKRQLNQIKEILEQDPGAVEK